MGGDHAFRAVRPDHPVLKIVRFAVAHGLRDDHLDTFAVGGMDALHIGVIGGPELAGLEAIDPVQLGGPHDVVVLDVPFPSCVAHKSHRSELNRRPLDYESRALPLSYGGGRSHNLATQGRARYSFANRASLNGNPSRTPRSVSRLSARRTSPGVP